MRDFCLAEDFRQTGAKHDNKADQRTERAEGLINRVGKPKDRFAVKDCAKNYAEENGHIHVLAPEHQDDVKEQRQETHKGFRSKIIVFPPFIFVKILILLYISTMWMAGPATK